MRLAFTAMRALETLLCELGKLTVRVCKKRGGKRFMAYKIPGVCA